MMKYGYGTFSEIQKQADAMAAAGGTVDPLGDAADRLSAADTLSSIHPSVSLSVDLDDELEALVPDTKTRFEEL